VHCADAKEAEVNVNDQFIHAIEAFINVLIESRKLERLEERGSIFEISNLQFPLSTLLTHLPLHLRILHHPNK
jgi:hypothetical protein